MTTCVLYLGTDGKSIINRNVSLPGYENVYTDESGIARYTPDLPEFQVLILKEGEKAIKVTCPKITEPYTPPTATGSNTYTGITRAAFGRGYDPANFPCLQGQFPVDQYLSAPIRVQFRNRDGGESGAWYANSEKELWKQLDAIGIDSSSICPQYKAPITTPKPLPSLLEALVSSIQEIVSGMASRLEALEDFTKRFWDKLESWLVERILDIIWKALTTTGRKGV